MSYAQNIFTTTSPNETDFVITWTPPYYMTTADVKAEVDKVAWTVVSVSGTNVTLATGIPVDSTVRIYRETDVSSNEVDFLAGSPFRAGDVNENFNQTLFAIQEALTSDENHEADINRLEGLINTILALLNNNIQFVQVANVAALDTVAATDPENLKGYEVVDSTGLEGANPEIPLLPPKAGTGTGEDPVTGVYWDSGISTKVLWDKANQNWIYLSYFASNGDNRYQQITLQQATAPTVADFKNGTLWFNTTDQNLYVLYDDSSTRSWVLVGPLRDDRYVNRTGDSMTGDLLLNNADLVFEGSTDDGFETTLTVTDPTADNSIVLPDVSGNVVTTGDTGTVTSTMISDGTIVDADVNASAAIGLSKLATGALPTGITVASANIVDGSIVNADINASAAIDLSKLATGSLPTAITVTSANIVDDTIVDADINSSAAIGLSKLATGALPTGITVASANIVDDTIVDADINSSAAIGLSKLATGALPTGITVTSDNIVNDTIVDADINSSAAIGLSKLATGALPTGITVASANIVDDTIIDADINSSAAIGLSKLATGALPTGITVASDNIVDDSIVDADINASAAIDLTKLGSGALPSNITVNSDNITNLSIVNDDVNANAEIEVSKLANGTARQLLQTDAAGTGVEFTSDVDVPGTLDVTGNAVFDGSGTFSTEVVAGVRDSQGVFMTSAGAIESFSSSSRKWNISGSGSASFSSITADSTGGQVTSEYNLVTKNTSASLGLFIGCSDAANASSSNSNATIAGNGEIITNGNLTSNAGVYVVVQGTPSTGTAFQIYQGSTSYVQFLDNGTATFAGSVTASNVSDVRFKENITDARPQLADAVALGSQLKNFDWNDDAPLNEELRAKRFIGLIAQEAEKVCPGLTYTVPRTKQGEELTPETIDEDGNVTPATYEELDDSYKAINHDILVMKLLGAVAELTARVEELENK